MEFNIERRTRKSNLHFPEKEFDIARKFSKKIYKEFGEFVKGVILFGSSVQKKKLGKEADIDVLVILDDVSINFSRELVQTYRIIVEKIMADMKEGKRLHIQSMKFSSFWEYVRAGDPVAINILRYGIALIDTGFFDPLQMLLDNGRIRPSHEAMYNYYIMAPASVTRAKEHLLSATVDLYWATVDAAHAALMSYGYIPPTPEHVADMLDEVLVRKNILKKKHSKIMRNNYKIFKNIVHRNIKEIEGKDYDKIKKQTCEFVNEIRKILEKKKKEKKF